MLNKKASVIGFASRAASGKAVKVAKKYKKSVIANTPNDKDAVEFAKKSVKAAKSQQAFVRGTGVAAGAGGAYIATQGRKEESLIPKDY